MLWLAVGDPDELAVLDLQDHRGFDRIAAARLELQRPGHPSYFGMFASASRTACRSALPAVRIASVISPMASYVGGDVVRSLAVFGRVVGDELLRDRCGDLG